MSNNITCRNCHNTISTTSASANIVRCPCCTTLISIQTRDCLDKRKLPSCFGWFSKLQGHGSSSSSTAATLSTAAASRRFNSMNDSAGTAAGHIPKRAVLCGVSYQRQKHRLRGTVNDVKRMKNLLVKTFGFPENIICVLTEEEGNVTPTKENIQKALRWLVADCKPGDSLVFYFSGHGLRQPDFDDDERDGFDETICPTDFMTAGMILDNEINNTIVKPLIEGVTLHAIIDACHSGTVLDLEHVYDFRNKRWVNNRPPSGASKGTSGGRAISLCACADDKMAADTSVRSLSSVERIKEKEADIGKALSTRNEMAGAMTFVFVQTVEANSQITYGALLQEMHKKIAFVNRIGCFNSPFMKKVCRIRSIQDPLLSSSEIFDPHTKEFKL